MFPDHPDSAPRLSDGTSVNLARVPGVDDSTWDEAPRRVVWQRFEEDKKARNHFFKPYTSTLNYNISCHACFFAFWSLEPLQR